MAKKAALKRRAFFVDEHRLRRAKKALGLSTDSEVVREAIDRVAEMDEFWAFMKKTRGILEPGSVDKP
jgi:hypothetical protein